MDLIWVLKSTFSSAKRKYGSNNKEREAKRMVLIVKNRFKNTNGGMLTLKK
jgi:hypothetical protein